MKTRILLIMLALSMLLSGCGGNKVSDSGADPEFLEYLETADFPLETDKKITVWSWTGGAAVGTHTDPNNFPSVLEFEKNTGVDVEFIFPTGNVKEQFNLLIASGDLPDIINYYWAVPADFPGGPEKAISDGYIAPLNDLIPKYMPNFQKYLEENERADKEIKTDSGKYYYVPSYVTSEEDNGGVTCGFIFRKDWLDELNLPIPETWDDWYVTLKAFKEKKGADVPLSLIYQVLKTGGITNPFDFSLGLYLDDGKVAYGFAENEYKEFLTEMNKWYNEGLLDPNIASIDQKSVDSKIISGRAGATFGWLSSMLKWTSAARQSDPDFELVGVPFPVKEKGDTPKYGHRDPMVYNAGWAINASSPNKELAAKLLDYGFSEKGIEALNFGRENETFVVEDGQYKLTDLINHNPEGIDYGPASDYYIRTAGIPTVLIKNKGARGTYRQYYSLPEQNAAKDTWGNNDPRETKLPTSIAPPAEKASAYAKVLTDLNAYTDEMMLKFITGVEPLSNFDSYIKEMETYGLKELVDITQESYDNYLNR